MSKKPVFLLALGCTVALADEPLTLHCVGQMTETFRLLPSRTELKTTTIQGERYYELSDAEVVEHIGTLTVSTTRPQIDGRGNSDALSQSGTYTITPVSITFHVRSATTYSDNSADVDNRSFIIDRQTARWQVNETYTGPMMDIVFPRGHVEKSVTAVGTCEPWNPKPKF